MPAFTYTALNKKGKQVKQSIESSSMETAKSSLRAAGYTILEIKPQSVLEKDIDLPFLGNPKPKDMAIFCRQFVSILRAGVPVSTVLQMLSQQTENKKLRTAIREMQASVEKGDSLASAMRRQSKIFPNMLVNMVAAGEESGNLEESMRQMEIYFEKSQRTKNAVGKAMIYPCVLIVVMIVVLIVMMAKIIPKFLATFKEMDAELPAITQGLMNLCEWMGRSWLWLLGGLIIFVAICVAFYRTNGGRHFFDGIARKLPLFGSLTVKSACATFCRTLSLLLASGLTLVESLDLCAANMENIWFRDAVRTIRGQIEAGWSLTSALEQSGLFPPMVYNLVGIGEETGDLQDMLSKTADYYDEEVESTTQKLLALLEPITIIFMAGFVILIVLAIFLPMLNMTSMYDQYLQ